MATTVGDPQFPTYNIQSKIYTLRTQLYDAVHTLRIRLYGDIVVT